MPDVHIGTSFNVLLLLAAALGAGVLAFISYRVTLPPVSRLLRSVLATLRGVSLFLLFLLIGEPLLSLIHHRTEKPLVALLIDQSRSMTLKDRQGDRKTRLLGAVESPAVQELGAAGTVLFGAFDSRLHLFQAFTRDSLIFAGEWTDIGGALKELKRLTAERNLQAVLLLSDGTTTTGSSPLYEAEELGFPVFTVGIGDSSEPRDLLVRKAVSNTITYVGNRVPVNATVKSSGYIQERVEAILSEGGKALDRRTLTLAPGIRDYDVPLSFIPDQEGTKKILIEVSNLPGEISTENNRLSFFVKVLRSKMQVVLISGSPGADFAAVRRVLQNDQNIEVKAFVERTGGQFYEGILTDQALRDADCIVLIDYPRSGSAAATLAAIASAVASGKGLFFVPGRGVDFRKLSLLEQFLPFIVPTQSAGEGQEFLIVSDDQRNHPIVRSTAIDIWTKLPPLFTIMAPLRAKPESEVLGRTRGQNTTAGDPLFLSRRIGRSKSLALAGYGIWRWRSYSEGIPGGEQVFDTFMLNSVRWLVTRDDEKPVQVRPTKEMFSGSDPVEFTAQVYDDNYQPMESAEVTLSVTRKGESSQLTLTSLGNGRFEGAFDPLPEGDYTYTAAIVAGGQPHSEQRGTFSVGGLNAEYLDTRANTVLLQQVAERTGGHYYEPENLSRLPGDLASLPNFRIREVSVSQQFELWNRSWMLVCIVALFALEWIVRKRYGML